MKKTRIDKIGTITSKVHDTKSKFLIGEEKFQYIKRIYCYTSEDGIHGFFPVYKDENLNSIIFQDSFYIEFKKTHLEKLNNKLISHKKNLSITTLEFSDKEVINSITCRFDEENQKIIAIKIKTTKDTYVIGDRLMLNKTLLKIVKEKHFIPGMKLTFQQDNNMIYLSSLAAYFEHDENYHKFIVEKYTIDYLAFFMKTYGIFENIFLKLIKFSFVLFLLLGIFIFFFKSTTNLTGGDVLIEERDLIHDTIKIHTDEHGFQHIKAKNIEDSYFGIGFVHAKERLWQMEFLRRIARGKLSEIFGEKTLEIDRFIKSIGLNYISEKNSEYFMYNSNYYKIFQKYMDGINYYAAYYPLPIEYKITFSTFKYWELTDSVAVFNFISFTLSHDWENELWYKYIEENLGKEFADVIVSFSEMNHPFSNESVINDDELVELNMHKNRKKSDESIKLEREKAEKIANQQRKKEEKVMEKKRFENETKKVEKKTENVKKVEKVIDNRENIIGNMGTSDGASNSWVISGKHSASGSSILANDPHLTNSMPSNLLVLKVYLEDNVLSGATYPTLPFIMTGSNKNLSWGITTENGDVIDICEEKIEDDYYFFNGKKIKIVETEEFIDVKGGKQEKVVTRWTRNGPIINKVLKEFNRLNIDLNYDVPLSMRISSYLFDFNSFSFYFKLNYASDPQTIIDDAENFSNTNFHVVWATKNDIGYFPLGKFPVKTYRHRFCRGYTSQDDVVKFLKKTDLPNLKNPKKGFIVTANNRFVNFNFTYSLGGNQNQVRAYRIRELIEKKIKNLEKFEIEDNIKIVQDQKDSLAAIILPQILDIYERNKKKGKNTNENALNHINLLKNWDFVMNKNSTEATIFSVLEFNLGRNILGNKLPSPNTNGLMNLLPYWNFIAGIIQKIHAEEEVEMSQCASVGGSKNCEKYIVSVLNNLDNYLEDYKDSIGNVKKWGDVLFNDYPHVPFDNIPVLNKIFSRQKKTGGNRNTVNLARGAYNEKKAQFISTNSASFKFICDMSDPTSPYLIMNTGNSGNIFSKFYDNLLEKNENGELIKFSNIDLDKMENADHSTIFIKPVFPIEKEVIKKNFKGKNKI